VIRGHPELKYFVGMDVDPVASDVAQSRISSVLDDRESSVKVFTVLRNFRHIKSVLRGTGEEHLGPSSVDGILMDLGMSSMQVHFQHYIGYMDLLSLLCRIHGFKL
jgi:16S rRNA (cytosine1402-N4)-methyltransferase